MGYLSKGLRQSLIKLTLGHKENDGLIELSFEEVEEEHMLNQYRCVCACVMCVCLSHLYTMKGVRESKTLSEVWETTRIERGRGGGERSEMRWRKLNSSFLSSFILNLAQRKWQPVMPPPSLSLSLSLTFSPSNCVWGGCLLCKANCGCLLWHCCMLWLELWFGWVSPSSSTVLWIERASLSRRQDTLQQPKHNLGGGEAS